MRVERRLIAVQLVDEAVATLIEMIGAMLGGADAEPDLDAAVDRLRTLDRQRLGAVYDAFRETVVFHRLIGAPALLAAAQAMTGARRLHAPFQHSVFRMDLAGEHWRGFGWHQDYPYNMLSGASVTAWMPLTPANAANGAIDIAPRLSDRIYPVEIRYKRDALGRQFGGRDAFIAERLQSAFDSDAEKLALDPGDVVLFGNRLVHRSGFNPGLRHRFSIQVRFGDLLAPEVIERRWANRRTDGFDTFKSLHPHLVEYEEV
jgi:hypothetical protein